MNVMDRFSLKGRIALVTGGAQGLGLAMGLALSDAGANVIILDINMDTAAEAAKEMKAHGSDGLALYCDVTSEQDANTVVKTVMEKYGRIDILVNNAGICYHVPTHEMPLENWKNLMNINLNSIFVMSKAVAPVMMARKSGNIINTSSMSGFIVNTPQCQSAYNASKAGVIHMTRSLATEWAPYNIRVNSIAPGYMLTDMTKPTFEENGDEVRRWMDFSPMGRPGTPDELGGAVVYLASDASSFTTGSIITVDGGYCCW